MIYRTGRIGCPTVQSHANKPRMEYRRATFLYTILMNTLPSSPCPYSQPPPHFPPSELARAPEDLSLLVLPYSTGSLLSAVAKTGCSLLYYLYHSARRGEGFNLVTSYPLILLPSMSIPPQLN